MPKIVCFDFDDVLTEKSDLGRYVQVFGHVFTELKYGLELFEDNKNPKKFFRTMKKVVALGKGVRYDRYEKMADLLKPSSNAKKALKALKKRGCRVVLVSINDENMIRKFLKRHGMDKYVDHVYASRLGVKNGLLTGEILGDVVRTEKTGIVRKLEKLYRAKKSDILYVGDGMTDLPIMKKVGRGVLFCPNAVANAEVVTDRQLMKMQKDDRLFLVEDKDLMKIVEFVK